MHAPGGGVEGGDTLRLGEILNITQNGGVTSIYLDMLSGMEQWVCLMSDNHFDSVYCDRDLQTAHLEEAKKRDAVIIMTGDWYDAMQGRFDPRRSMAELREEYRREDYYDYVVNDSAAYLTPYRDNIVLMADGNHELSVLKAANTNLMDRLVGKLRDQGAKTVHGGYGGWVRFMIEMGGIPQGSIKLKYFHGSGGEAPVTRGVIQTARQAVYLPDADIVVNGHSHNSYYVPIARERISGKGRQFFDVQHHVRVPGYKQSYGDGSGGWDVTRGGVPKPLGCVWLKLTARKNDIMTVDIECIPDLRGGKPINPIGGVYSGVVFDDDGDQYRDN